MELKDLLLSKVVAQVVAVYGKPLDEIAAPDGYEFTGEFRACRTGDVFLSLGSGSLTCSGDSFQYERLILRKRQRYVFEVTGKTRRAEPGEWFMDGQRIQQASQRTYGAHPILRCIEKPE